MVKSLFYNPVLQLCVCLIPVIHSVSAGSLVPVCQFDDPELNLSPSGKKIENHIEISATVHAQSKLREVSGNKIYLGKSPVKINGEQVETEELKTRGKSSSYLRRKSFSFSFKEKITLNKENTAYSFKDFYAISLSMDRNYIRNRMAFGLLKELGLFHLFFTFGEIKINQESEGIYLLMERPQDWALKKKKSPFILRRGFDHKIDKMKGAKDMDHKNRKEYLSAFKEIYRLINKYQGDELIARLNEYMNLDEYMKWMAFNYFVKNGDYTDEVYFYINPQNDKFEIIPWDYDDIFALQPHEDKYGDTRHKKNILIFSTEDLLDKTIGTDPVLYRQYLVQLHAVLEQLDPDKIRDIIETTYAELYPYYMNAEIISMSGYDAYPLTNIDLLQSDLRSIFRSLILIRNNLLSILGKTDY